MAEAAGQWQAALDTLIRALEVEYRFILYYPQLERLMPDEDTAQKVKALGEASVRHADVVSQGITSLGGQPRGPILEPLPEPLDLTALFRTQLDYEKLALWLHNQAVGLVPTELAPRFRQIAQEEEWHIRLTQDILHKLEQGPG